MLSNTTALSWTIYCHLLLKCQFLLTVRKVIIYAFYVCHWGDNGWWCCTGLDLTLIWEFFWYFVLISRCLFKSSIRNWMNILIISFSSKWELQVLLFYFLLHISFVTVSNIPRKDPLYNNLLWKKTVNLPGRPNTLMHVHTYTWMHTMKHIRKILMQSV